LKVSRLKLFAKSATKKEVPKAKKAIDKSETCFFDMAWFWGFCTESSRKASIKNPQLTIIQSYIRLTSHRYQVRIPQNIAPIMIKPEVTLKTTPTQKIHKNFVLSYSGS